MIEAFKSNNKAYGKMGDTILKPNKCIVTRKLPIDSQSMVYELEIEHKYDKEGRWEYIAPENVIRAPTPGGKKQLFRIYKIEKDNNSIIGYANHVFFDTQHIFIEMNTTKDLSNESLKNILDETLEDTDFTHNIQSGYFSTDVDCFSIFDFLLSDYEYNIKQDYEIDIDNFNIKLIKKPETIGQDNGCRADFGYNIKDIKEITDYSELCTKILAYAIDSDGTKWSTNVKSQYIDDYEKVYTQSIDYTSRFLGEEDWDDPLDILKTGAELTFKKEDIDIPKVNYSISIESIRDSIHYNRYKQLEDLNIGDIVHCRNIRLNIVTNSRLIAYEFNAITQKYITQELGNFIPNFLQRIKSKK